MRTDPNTFAYAFDRAVGVCMRISEFDWIYVTQHIVNLQWVDINVSSTFFFQSYRHRQCHRCCGCRYRRRLFFTFLLPMVSVPLTVLCLIFVFHRVMVSWHQWFWRTLVVMLNRYDFNSNPLYKPERNFFAPPQFLVKKKWLTKSFGFRIWFFFLRCIHIHIGLRI